MALLGHLSAAFAYYSGQRTPHNGISPLNPCLSVDAKCATKALKAVMYFYVQKLMQFKIVSIGKPQKFLIMLNLCLPQKCLDWFELPIVMILIPSLPMSWATVWKHTSRSQYCLRAFIIVFRAQELLKHTAWGLTGWQNELSCWFMPLSQLQWLGKLRLKACIERSESVFPFYPMLCALRILSRESQKT